MVRTIVVAFAGAPVESRTVTDRGIGSPTSYAIYAPFMVAVLVDAETKAAVLATAVPIAGTGTGRVEALGTTISATAMPGTGTMVTAIDHGVVIRMIVTAPTTAVVAAIVPDAARTEDGFPLIPATLVVS
jgi:hypothetical protein